MQYHELIVEASREMVWTCMTGKGTIVCWLHQEKKKNALLTPRNRSFQMTDAK